jgi:hypothetical protein
MVKLTPLSLNVGTSGNWSKRRSSPNAIALETAVQNERQYGHRSAEDDLCGTRNGRHRRRTVAVERHVGHLGTGLALEKLGGQMRTAAQAIGCIVQLARILP